MNRTALLVAAFVSLSTSLAQATSIAIVRPASAASPVAEAVHRLEGELFALGLEVRRVDRVTRREPVTDGSHGALSEVTAEPGIDAVIEVDAEASPAAVDVWIFEPSSQRFRLSRVVLDSNATPVAETLAIRAIEVLRSNFVEIDLAARARSEAPVAPRVREDAPAPPPRSDAQFGLEAGVAVLGSLDGVGPALLPLVRLDWVASSWLVAQVTLAGLGTRPTITSDVGSASVTQGYGLIGLCYTPPPLAAVVRPFVGISSGALRTSLSGEADAPERGGDVTQWSFLVEAGLGARIGLGERYHLTPAFHVALAEPYVAVHFVDQEVASTGHPNLAASLTFGAWL